MHRAKVAQQKAVELGFEVVALPGYSPDLNYCQPSLDALFAACKKFVADVNVNPDDLVRRLWPRFELDPEEEKLRVSA